MALSYTFLISKCLWHIIRAVITLIHIQEDGLRSETVKRDQETANSEDASCELLNVLSRSHVMSLIAQELARLLS